MLEYLLAKGFDVNTMPLTNPTRCFIPVMATVIYHKTFNKAAFDLLAASPRINFNIRTPVYGVGVHLLHFAVATLNLDMLKHIARKIPLKYAGKRKLGHTLLHIACLQADAQLVQYHSLAIYQSIHETRDLHAHNDPRMELTGCMQLDHGVSGEELKMQAAQTEVVKYLCDKGIYQVWEKDVHGNTPLHYLVGCREVNTDLLTWRLEDGVGKLFKESFNIYGYTTEKLFCDGKMVKEALERGWMGTRRSTNRGL